MPDTIPASKATTALISTFGTAVTSTIDTLGDRDWFQVTLVAGQKYVFTLDGTTLSDPFMYLYNSSGTLITFNDDANVYTSSSQITYTATSSGTFYVGAGALNDGGTGAYRVTAYQTSAPLTLDQIADYLAVGAWNGQGYHFATSTITYNISGLTAAQQTIARLAIHDWDDIGKFSFVETTGSAQITFNHNESGAAYTYADGTSATITISSDWNGGSTAIYDYTLQTYIHEIGHALGLGHAGPYNGSATFGTDNLYSNDSWVDSVMSYFAQDEAGAGTFDFLMTPAVADVIAIGNIYGLSTTTRTGDTTYGFHSNAGQIYSFSDAIYNGATPALTLFDNGGTDTIDVSGYTINQRIDLNADTHSDIGGSLNNIGIARGTVIENAIGGNGADLITGNSVANSLDGGNGNDTLIGGSGNDTLIGGAGTDTADYSASTSGIVAVIFGGAGAVIGGTDVGTDGLSSIERIVGTSSNDVIYADSQTQIDGGAGFDYLVLMSTSAVLHLGTSVDNSIEMTVLNGGTNTVDITGSAFTDVWGTSGNDTITLGSGGGYVWGGGGTNVLNGGTGQTIFIGDYTGSSAMHGHSGNDLFYVTNNDTVTSVAGYNYLVFVDYHPSGTPTNANLAIGAEHINYAVGGSGDDVIDNTGGTASILTYGLIGNDTLMGGSAADTLLGNEGNDRLVGGLGDDQLYGGTGSNTFAFANGWGHDNINDWTAGTSNVIDMASLAANGVHSMSNLTIAVVGGSTVITHGSDTVTVVGYTGLTASDFHFA